MKVDSTYLHAAGTKEMPAVVDRIRMDCCVLIHQVTLGFKSKPAAEKEIAALYLHLSTLSGAYDATCTNTGPQDPTMKLVMMHFTYAENVLSRTKTVIEKIETPSEALL